LTFYWTSEYIKVGAVGLRWMTEVKGQCYEGRWMDRWMNGSVNNWKDRYICKWLDLKDRWMKV
jgi:hypothetical protein